MKKYVYIFIGLIIVALGASAQIKIGNYSFKDGAEYEVKGIIGAFSSEFRV